MYERPKSKTTFFSASKPKPSAVKSTPKDHPLIQLIKAGDSQKISEFLQCSALSLGDTNTPILMLQTNQEDIKKLLVDKIQQEISILHDKNKTPKFGRSEKIRLMFLYLNLALYYHDQEKFEMQWCENNYNVLKAWDASIKGCTPKQAHEFAKLGLIVGGIYLKISEPQRSIRYFEDAIELEQKNNPKNKESQRRRLLYLVENLIKIYLIRHNRQRGYALSDHILAAKYNLLRLTLVHSYRNDHKIKVINHFNPIYEVIVKLLNTLNTMDEVDLFVKENIELLNEITLPRLKEQLTELTKTIAEVQISDQALLEKFRTLLQEAEHKAEEFMLKCSRAEITLV